MQVELPAMSAATSPGTGLAYGLRRVCAASPAPTPIEADLEASPWEGEGYRRGATARTGSR